MIKFLQRAYEAHSDYSEIKRKLEAEKLLTSKQVSVYNKMIENYVCKYISTEMSCTFLFIELNNLVYNYENKLCKILSKIPLDTKKKTTRKKEAKK